MLLATSKTKNNLVRTVLASGVLISSMAYMNVANAVFREIDGADVATTDAMPPAANAVPISGTDTFEFKSDNKLTILDGYGAPGVGVVPSAGGISIKNTAGAADKGTILTQGSVTFDGSVGISDDGALKLITTTGAAKTLIFTGAVASKNIELQGTTSSTFKAAVTTTEDVILLNSANADFKTTLNARDLELGGNKHTVTIGGVLTLTGNLNGQAAAGNTSTLNVTGASNITGNIKAEDNFQGTFKGNVTANKIQAVAAGAILTFNGQADAGGLVTASNGGVINFNGGGTAAAGITLTQDSRVNFFNANYAVNGADLDRAGTSTIAVGAGVTVTVGGGNDMLDAGAGSKLVFDFGDTLTPGLIDVSGGAAIDNSQILILQNYDISQLAVGTTQTSILVKDTAGAIGDVPQLQGDINNPFISFTLTKTNLDTRLNLVMTRQVPTTLEGNANNLGGVFALIDKTNTTGALLELVNGLGDIATSPEDLNEELAEIAPQGINGSLVDSSFGVTNETFDLFSQRISELRAGLDGYNTGYAAGHMTESGHGTWVKIFGSHADQSRRGNIAGYDGETWGLAAGADMMITERHLVGVSLAWASTDVNFDSQRGGSDFNSYQGAFYGSWNITTPLFVNWMASAAFNKYKETQLINVGGFSQASLGEFDGWQYGARAELGYVFGEECFHITPTADLTYTHVSFDSFQQKGNSTANQIIDYGSVSALLAGVGVKFSYDYEMQKALLQPEVHANVSYDIIGDEMDANARFVGFATAYNVQGASVKRTDYNVGLSLTTYGDSGLGFSISYDYDWKSHFHAHSGFFRIRYEW